MFHPDRLTIPQAAKRLGVSSQSVHKMIRAGRLAIIDREAFPGGERFWLAKGQVEDLRRARRPR